jgi:hypothetical protein
LSDELQSIIAQGIVIEEYVVLLSLDLSAPFDIVYVSLLIMRLKIVGLPTDLTELIKDWLRKRLFYLAINGNTSTFFNLLLRTVQGLVPSPVIYAIYMSPMWDLKYALSFANDSLIPSANILLVQLITKLEAIGGNGQVARTVRHEGE